MPNNKLIIGKDNNNNIIIIDKDKLKSLERLDNADVFKLLFKLNDDDHRFGDFSMDSTDGYVNIFKNFDISSEDWYLLISFLKYGFTPHYSQLDKESINTVENLNNVCNKLGGIPSFDIYYRDFYDKIYNNKKENDIYNPQSPEEDTKKIYKWVLLDNNHQGNRNNFSFFISTNSSEWSAHKTFNNGIYLFVWYRSINHIS